MHDVRIRPGRPEDGPQLLKVHRNSILALGGAGYGPPEVESWAFGLTAEGYGRAMTEEGETFAVALLGDERIIGFCSHKIDEIMGLYVHPDWVGRGVGGRLLQEGEAAIAARGHETARLSAALGARGFYERRGYRVVQRRGWKSRGGLVSDVLDMAKDL